MPSRYSIAQLDQLPGVPCPCGTSARAFMGDEAGVATIHRVQISKEARVHYHRKLTEIYLILEGTGFMELDGERFAVKPMTTILIKPGCRHRAVGDMTIINVAVPAFDPDDEWFDPEPKE